MASQSRPSLVRMAIPTSLNDPPASPFLPCPSGHNTTGNSTLNSPPSSPPLPGQHGNICSSVLSQLAAPPDCLCPIFARLPDVDGSVCLPVHPNHTVRRNLQHQAQPGVAGSILWAGKAHLGLVAPPPPTGPIINPSPRCPPSSVRQYPQQLNAEPSSFSLLARDYTGNIPSISKPIACSPAPLLPQNFTSLEP